MSSIYSYIIPKTVRLTSKDAVVVDDFETKCVDVDGDGIADISHGRAVAEQLVDSAPHYNVLGLHQDTGNEDELLNVVA